MDSRLDGRAIAKSVRTATRNAVESFSAHADPPALAVVLVGDHPASASYVRGKKRAASEVGIQSTVHRRDASISQHELLDLIRTLNADDAVDGILVQLPLPDHIDQYAVIETIDPTKDVDGFHPQNLGRLLIGTPQFVPATPAGIMVLLERALDDLAGARAVVVGRSNIVGKPLAALLMQRDANATVTVCHSRTRDLAAHTKAADIVIAAAGRPNLITADMVSDGVTVIDVGINRVDDDSRERGYRLVGDVDYDAVAPKAHAITPVPGGVGPMTIAMLLRNTLQAAQHRRA
ncbi:MAG: bifunctional methylenetetrahydrofolate dehydrogenase/methenyltetrahydrofolate cyclohydrolase FolD [Longimonas sp.]|uniref:bifunctional methylenetetrahydrofolate dehydrogenase/methenyltetrahydrofolate cyclohydrolase FolD n=1 Tax=Longimonas sp. TaxID=2039626 RepID=UPI0033512925